MTDPVAKKMSQASATPGGAATQERAAPKKGERYRCTNCGMEVQVTADCTLCASRADSDWTSSPVLRNVKSTRGAMICRCA